jgi:hypothetical protein
MTDTDTNVTVLHPSPHAGEGTPRSAKDPTAALRARRARRKRKIAPTVTLPVPTSEIPQLKNPRDINANVTVVGHARHLTAATLAAALALATVSAGFSITGLTNIFVGAFWPVISMGVALEVGKLSAVAWLGRHQGAALKAALGILVAVLMALNAVGAYGFLAQAHIGHAVAGEVATLTKGADVDARLNVQVGIVADLDRRIAQIDGAVEKATSKGRTGAAMALADQQRKTRTELVAQRTSEARTLAGLQVEKAAADGERRKVEADLGPVRYLASLLGSTDEETMRWFILAVALLLDPAAVLLLLAATRRR